MTGAGASEGSDPGASIGFRPRGQSAGIQRASLAVAGSDSGTDIHSRPVRPSAGGQRASLAAVVVVLAVGAVMRFVRLGDTWPGFYRDEAIEACQALALLKGEILPSDPYIMFARFPLWNLAEIPFMALDGHSVLAARLPAALTGLLTAALAYPVLASLFGPWSGVLGTGMIAFSLWHLVYSRLAVPVVLVPLQGLILAWLVMRPTGSGTVTRRAGAWGLAAGLVAGSGIFSYYAGFSLVPALVAAVMARLYADGEFRKRGGAFTSGAVMGLLIASALVFLRHDSFAGVTRFPRAGLSDLPGNLLACLAATFLHSGGEAEAMRIGIWSVYPPGAPLLSPLETAAVLAGLWGLWGPSALRWQTAAVLAWLVAGLLPAAFGADGVRASRCAGALVPLVLLASIGVRQAMARVPRFMPAVVGAWLALQCGLTAHGLFGGYLRDPRVALWADRPETEAALYLKARTADEPVVLASPMSYLTNPVAWFLLRTEIASGRLRLKPGPVPSAPLVEKVIRDPVYGQPAFFVLRSRGSEYGGPPVLALVSPEGILGVGDGLMREGLWREAAAHYYQVLRLFPDFRLARLRYEEALRH